MPPPATAPQTAPPMAVPNAPAPIAQTSEGLGKALWLREEFKKPPNKRHPSLRGLKDPQDFQVYGPQVFDQMAAQDPNFASHWESIAAGQAPQSQTTLAKLPKKYREMPNAPTGAPAEFDPVSGQLSRAGKSPRANQTFKDMADALTSRRNAATQAVAAKKQEMVNDVPGTVDRMIAANDNQLAQDGITDMGGGNMAMRNKYGTGSSTRSIDMNWKGGLSVGQDVPGYGKIVSLDPKKGATFENGVTLAPKTPGVVRDEKGVVDMGKTAGGNTIAYVPGSTETPSLNKDAIDANRAQIEKNIALMAPGAAERRTADRNAIVANTQRRVNVNMDANRPIASVINKGLPAIPGVAETGTPGTFGPKGPVPGTGTPGVAAVPAVPAQTAPHAWPGQPGFGENFPQVRQQAVAANQAETRGASPYAPQTVESTIMQTAGPQAGPMPAPATNVALAPTVVSKTAGGLPSDTPKYMAEAARQQGTMKQSYNIALSPPKVSNTMPPAPMVAQTPKKKPVRQ